MKNELVICYMINNYTIIILLSCLSKQNLNLPMFDAHETRK